MQADELLNVPITEDLDSNACDYLEQFNRSVPRKLYGSIEHWLETNSDGPTKFRTTTAPLGMVMRWIERAEQAEAFKKYVHERLDAMGVPVNPDPAKTEETGCRIGPRLDWLAEKSLAAIQQSQPPPTQLANRKDDR